MTETRSITGKLGSPAAVSAVFIGAGVLHFVIPDTYKRIVPRYLPAPDALVLASGVAEIAGGVAMLHPRTRRRGAQWLVATLVAVFPANLHMALNAEHYKEVPGGAPALYGRLPLQGAFIAWVMRAGRR